MRVLLVLVLLLKTAGAVDPQVWTSRDGQNFTGDFLTVRPGKVYVRGEKGRIYAIPMRRLTDACLAEAGYLQEKLGEWARQQVDRKAMTESTANAVLMLEPHGFAGKIFVMDAKVWSIDHGTKLRPAKGPRVNFTSEIGVPFYGDFPGRGELVVTDDAVYADAPRGAEVVSTRNATQLIALRHQVPVKVIVKKGKFAGGRMVPLEDLEQAREADGEVREYEEEIARLRIAVYEEQMSTGVSLRGKVPLLGADNKELVIPEHRFSEAEMEQMKMELSWLTMKVNQELPSLRRK